MYSVYPLEMFRRRSICRTPTLNEYIFKSEKSLHMCTFFFAIMFSLL